MPDMRTRLHLLTAVTVILAALAGHQSAHAGASACTATATGHHARQQVLAVHLSAGCPSAGTATGALSFSQYPGIRGRTSFTINYAEATIAIRMPATLSIAPAWTAHSATPALEVSIKATPKRQVFGAGKLTINGGFRAANGALVTWAQTLTATPDRVTLGSIRIHAQFPGGRRMVIQVHQDRSFCATGKTCPFAHSVTTETYSFPPSFTSASVTSTSSFITGNGTLRWGRELPVILLRDAATGRILGRSDLLAVVRVPS
jgi:hypothetical protein